MKKQKFYFIFLLLLFIPFSSLLATPIDDLLNRIGGEGTSDRILTQIIPSSDEKDYFTITSDNGKPQIIGNNYLSLATGIHWYLKYYANVLLTWNNLTTDLSLVVLPVPEIAETHFTDIKYRYYLNYCTYSYTMAFWNWERWQQEIDWMAMHGINMPLALIGTEVVWRNVLVNNLGYSKEDANKFIAGPAFQAWFLMNNMEGWGGPNPDSWYVQQEALQKKIVERMRELNMEPVFAGYSGMVPHDIKEKKGWNIANPGTWCGFQRPGFLLPTDPNFNDMARFYYDEMKKLYGTSAYYSMDPFHEGGSVKGVDLPAAFKAIYNAMKNYSGHQGSTPQWVIQSWNENPRQEALDALSPGTLIVLDLFSDAKKEWGSSYAQTGGKKHEFVYCMLNNFGGRTGLHGRFKRTIDDFYAAKEQFPQTMLGVGATMEGSENNPVLYEVLYELPWREMKIESEDWMKDYAKIRYGKTNEMIEQAWFKLLNSVYACPTAQQGVSEPVICARPALEVPRVSSWSTSNIYWDVNEVVEAAELMLAQSEFLSGKNYEYDIVDIVRQVLSDYSYGLLKDIKKARDEKNTLRFNALTDRFLNIILDQDRLLNTIPDFMLGTSIDRARSLSDIKEEKDLYEKNARLLVSTWGPAVSANGDNGLKDYSNREWGGLMKDYYYPRWKLMFDRLKAGQQAPANAYYFTMEYKWATTPTTDIPYPNTPQGNPIEIAKEIFGNYYMNLSLDAETNETIFVPVEGKVNREKELVVYRGNTLELSFPAQGAMKLFIDLNANGTYEEGEQFEPEIINDLAVFNVSIPIDAAFGQKSELLLQTDVSGTLIDPAKDPNCGLRFTLPLIIMDEIETQREVSVQLGPEMDTAGEVAIKGTDKLLVNSKDVVIIEAISKVGWDFIEWTDATGKVVSTQEIYIYCGKEPIELTAWFKKKGIIYELPASVNSVQVLRFNPALSTKNEWTIEAETKLYGKSYNQWGSAILSDGTDPFTITKFQYYLRKEDNELRFNDESVVAHVIPDPVKGTTIRVKLVSDGTGKIHTQLLVDRKEHEIYSVTMPSLSSISKGTVYPTSIALMEKVKTGEEQILTDNSYTVYSEKGKIIVLGLDIDEIYDVYTSTGIKVNSKSENLSAGIYIVVINNLHSFKVIV